jgi:fructokinase
MYDIAALGELLIDFTPNGQNEMGMSLFARNPGGAPGNVLVMATRLGCSTAFIGKVGKDDFGFFLRDILDKNGIDTAGLVMTPEVNTTLAFVQLNEDGDRSFSFYRRPGADMMLTTDEVKKDLIEQAAIFHFGSVSLTSEPCRGATFFAAKAAKNQGKLISFDPNYRPPLWDYDLERAKAEILAALPLADVLKVSEEELSLLTGQNDIEHGAELLAQQGPSVILVSRGPDGAYCWTKNLKETLPTYDVKTVDTTGAGDAFLGAVLFRLRGYTVNRLNDIRTDEWRDILDFANAAGSLTTAKKGAIPAMPTLQAIENCRRTIPLLKIRR